MPRESTYTAFILKRTDYNETDQIVTMFTEQEGKLRALVKASKLPTSKLQPALQPLFKVSVTLVGNGGLPKIIGAQILQTYPNLFEEHKLHCWYLLSELLNKALADGSENIRLFQLVAQYLIFLDKADLSPEQINLSALQFQIKALTELGMGIASPKQSVAAWFSNNQGGFVPADSGADAVPVSESDFLLFRELQDKDFQVAANYQTSSKPLSQLINSFLTYQLERELKSAQFIKH